MSNMDVMSKQLWSTASTMRSQHHLHLHSTVTQNRQQNADPGLLLYKSKGGCVCPQTSLKSAKTLHMCPVWMWEAVKGGLQPQQWHNKVIYTGQRPGIEKIWPIRIGETNNLVRMHFYVHRQHLVLNSDSLKGSSVKVITYLWMICFGFTWKPYAANLPRGDLKSLIVKIACLAIVCSFRT